MEQEKHPLQGRKGCVHGYALHKDTTRKQADNKLDNNGNIEKSIPI